MKFLYLRLMLKTALAYLTIGLFLGIFIFLGYKYPSMAWAVSLKIVHVHLLLMGVVMQIIMGVALWMFPRAKDEPFVTPEREGMTLYIIFNAGTLLRSFSEPFAMTSDRGYWLAFLGMILQILGTFYFVILIAGRVRTPTIPEHLVKK